MQRTEKLKIPRVPWIVRWSKVKVFDSVKRARLNRTTDEMRDTITGIKWNLHTKGNEPLNRHLLLTWRDSVSGNAALLTADCRQDLHSLLYVFWRRRRLSHPYPRQSILLTCKSLLLKKKGHRCWILPQKWRQVNLQLKKATIMNSEHTSAAVQVKQQSRNKENRNQLMHHPFNLVSRKGGEEGRDTRATRQFWNCVTRNNIHASVYQTHAGVNDITAANFILSLRCAVQWRVYLSICGQLRSPCLIYDTLGFRGLFGTVCWCYNLKLTATIAFTWSTPPAICARIQAKSTVGTS